MGDPELVFVGDIHEDKERVVRGYFKDLGLVKSELKGRQVLDVGSGQDCFFAKHCQEQGITNDVYSIDLQIDSNNEKDVVGDGVFLPFNDEVFDLVISENAIPSMFYSILCMKDMREMFRQSIDEMLRITKPGGEIRFYPVYFVRQKEERASSFEQSYSYSGSLFDVAFNFLEQKLGELKRMRSCKVELEEREQIEVFETDVTPVMVRIVKEGVS